jgi:hypothetical protein
MMIAFVGTTGQDGYLLELRFGKKALSRYAKNLDIKDCIPSADYRDWLLVDPLNKKIIMQLN